MTAANNRSADVVFIDECSKEVVGAVSRRALAFPSRVMDETGLRHPPPQRQRLERRLGLQICWTAQLITHREN